MSQPTPTNPSDLASIWARLSENQRRYVVAMQTAKNRAEAAKVLGIPRQTIYKWPKYVDEAVRLVGEDITRSALDMLKGALVEAALGKVLEMTSDDERLAAAARTEILDRNLGKPTTRQEVDMSGSLGVSVTALDETLALLTRRAESLEDE